MALINFVDYVTSVTASWLNAIDVWYNNHITTNTTLNVPSSYATLKTAWDYLSTKTIEPGVTVTIQIADGTHDYTSVGPITLNHPQGNQISIVGNTSTPTNCVLTWTNQATGLDGLYVSNGYVLGNLNGVHITRTAHGNTNIGCGIVADYGAKIFLGTSVRVSNWYYGIAARYGSRIKANSAIVSGAGDVGIWAFSGSTVECNSATVSNTADSSANLGFGIQAEYGSMVYATSASSTTSRIAGIAALSGSVVRALSATASSNTGSGFYARDGGFIYADGATASTNTRYGIEEVTSGTVSYNSITSSGNTIGARAPIALVNADTTLTARVAATNGSLRLDTSDTSSVYFNTSGGSQAEIAHTGSAVDRVRITGSTAVTSPVIDVTGTTANQGITLRGTGTGGVFLGSSRANYVRINNAASTGTPEIYAEGSDTNIDLLLSGKGTGVVRFGTHTGGADTASNGYITIKDAAGNTRKLMTTA